MVSFFGFVRISARDVIWLLNNYDWGLKKKKKNEKKLEKMEAAVETLKIRMEELFPGKNLDEVNSMLTKFSKKHPILCEQMDLFKTDSSKAH